jgi:hypothetical protein
MHSAMFLWVGDNDEHARERGRPHTHRLRLRLRRRRAEGGVPSHSTPLVSDDARIGGPFDEGLPLVRTSRYVHGYTSGRVMVACS